MSCTTRQGKEKLLDEIAKRLKLRKKKAPAPPEMKIAVVGKRNAGKSTLINTLAGAAAGDRQRNSRDHAGFDRRAL